MNPQGVVCSLSQYSPFCASPQPPSPRLVFSDRLCVRWLPASVCNITVCKHFDCFSILPALRVISLWGIQSVSKNSGGRAAAAVPAFWVAGSISRSGRYC